jgi:hypothetical protein
MRRSGSKLIVWIVTVCDYEACWPVHIFDSEGKAKDSVSRYKLKGFEQRVSYYSMEVF